MFVDVQKMSQEFIFTDEEILKQLSSLGFDNVTDEQLRVFKLELNKLLQEDNVTSTAYCSERDGRGDQVDIAQQDIKLKGHDVEAPVERKRQYVTVEKLGRLNDLNYDFVPKSCSGSSLSRSHSSMSTLSDGLLEMESALQKIQSTASESTKDSSESGLSLRERPRTRKVLRRKHGSVIVCDESLQVNSSSLSSETNTRHSSTADREQAMRGDRIKLKPDAQQCTTDSSHRLRKWKSASDVQDDAKVFCRPKSVILPYVSRPRAPNIFKTDPVALYHYYKKEWARHNIPGERDHLQLRWNIRTMMSIRDGFYRLS